MSTADNIRNVAEQHAPEYDLEIFDVEFTGGVLRITADRIGKADPKAGTDIAMLQKLSRAVGHQIEEQDLISSSYTLEVSSPGVERKLRTPDHFQRSVGETVKVKTFPGGEGDRRAEGELIVADETGIELKLADTTRRFAYEEISSASTVFAWGGTKKGEKPNKQSKQSKSQDSPGSSDLETETEKRAAS